MSHGGAVQSRCQLSLPLSTASTTPSPSLTVPSRLSPEMTSSTTEEPPTDDDRVLDDFEEKAFFILGKTTRPRNWCITAVMWPYPFLQYAKPYEVMLIVALLSSSEVCMHVLCCYFHVKLTKLCLAIGSARTWKYSKDKSLHSALQNSATVYGKTWINKDWYIKSENETCRALDFRCVLKYYVVIVDWRTHERTKLSHDMQIDAVSRLRLCGIVW